MRFERGAGECGAYVIAAWKRNSKWGLRGRRGNLRAARRHCVRTVKTSRKQLHEWHWLLSLFNTHPNLIILGFIQTPVNYWSHCMLITEQIWGKRKSKLVSSWQREVEREKEREKDTIRGGHGKEKDNYSQGVVQNCTTLRSLIRLKKESCSIFAYTIKSIQWVRSAVHTNNINYSHRWNFKDLELEKNSERTTKPHVRCAVSWCFV